MLEKFLNLDSEKQKRILNSAMKEFAKKGYKNASTNEIVKEADIGKGMLFHYFNSKKDLFLFLYDYTTDTVMNEFYAKINFKEKDVLKRLYQALSVEFTLTNEYPDMFDFIKSANYEDFDEVKSDLESRNKQYITNSYGKLLEDVDVSMFKENININRAIQAVMWTLEGIGAREREKLKRLSVTTLDYNGLLAEMDAFLELFKKGFYKE